MRLAVIVAVFPVIFIGELPDKTMFASLLLATRGRPLAVWAGAAAAFVVHVSIAVTVGVALFHLLSRQAVDGVVAALFLFGPGYALVETFETLLRPWNIEGTSVRPFHRMVAHTGFITVARRVVPGEGSGLPLRREGD